MSIVNTSVLQVQCLLIMSCSIPLQNLRKRRPTATNSYSKAQNILIWTSGGKNRAHHKYKKNIAMTDCLVILCPAWRQSVFAIFCLYLWCARFFASCSPGLVYFGPNTAICTWSPILCNRQKYSCSMPWNLQTEQPVLKRWNVKFFKHKEHIEHWN